MDLSGCEIDDNVITPLADLLRNNTVFLIILIAAYLNLFQTLRSLNLSGNLIDDAGAQYLADALKNNTVYVIFFLHNINRTDLIGCCITVLEKYGRSLVSPIYRNENHYTMHTFAFQF